MGVAVFQVYLFTRIFHHLSRPPHCQISLAKRGYLARMTARKCPSLPDVDLYVEQLDRSIRNGVLCQSAQRRNRQTV